MAILRIIINLLLGGLLGALGCALWLRTRPPAVPERLPGPPIVFDKTHPDFLTIGDRSFQVTLALEPQASVPGWPCANHGGISRVSLDGIELLAPRGLPERWDHEGFVPPVGQARLYVEGGWIRGQGTPTELPATVHGVAIEGDAVVFSAQVPELGGYSHRFEKRIVVEPRRRRIEIAYTLVNRGTRPLSVLNYVHGFMNLGGGPIDGRYELDTALRPAETPDWLAVRAGGFAIAGPIQKPAFAPHLRKVQPPVLANRVVLHNRANGCSVLMEGDFPAHFFALYVEPTAIVPEVSVRLDLAPGRSASWRRWWEFRCDRKQASPDDRQRTP